VRSNTIVADEMRIMLVAALRAGPNRAGGETPRALASVDALDVTGGLRTAGRRTTVLCGRRSAALLETARQRADQAANPQQEDDQ
jgi:hypothetical protein